MAPEKPFFSSTPLVQILSAANFAARAHAQQKRKGAAAEPYINHLIEVAELVASSGHEADVNLIMACFLHDVVEDTSVTRHELAQTFTDDKSLPKEVRKAKQVQSAPAKSARAQTLKLADKISNLRSLLNSPPSNWSTERKLEY